MKIKFLTIVAAVALFSCEAATDNAEGAVDAGTENVEGVEGAEDEAMEEEAMEEEATETTEEANDTTAAKAEEMVEEEAEEVSAH